HFTLAFLSFFFFSSRRRHTRFDCDWSSDVCSSDLGELRFLTLHAFFAVAHHHAVKTLVGEFHLGNGENRIRCSRDVRSVEFPLRSEERRVGKECRSRWWTYH